jgi:hypothetical protein
VSAAITVSLIILLAGFGIFNVLTMSVLAKIKEIAILRSMGYRRRDISSIFLWQGALIAGAGSLLGCLLGAIMTWGISHIPFGSAVYFMPITSWSHGNGGTMSSLRCSRSSPSSLRVMFPRAEPLSCHRSHNSRRQMNAEICLSCHDIERYLGEEEERVHALRGVSLALEPGSIHAVVGPSGCGKSTLLYILGLLDPPDAGQVSIDSEPVYT